MIYRYSIFNSVTIFFVSYLAIYYDAWNFLIETDPTRVTLVIVAVYAACVGYLPFATDVAPIKFIASRLTGFGLVGTGLALFLMSGTLAAAQQDQSNALIFHALGTVFITMLAGIVSSLMLQFQIAWVGGDYADAD